MRKNVGLTVLGFLVISGSFLFVQHKKNKHINNEPPSDWFIAQRMYPYDRVDYDAYNEALQQAILLTRQPA